MRSIAIGINSKLSKMTFPSSMERWDCKMHTHENKRIFCVRVIIHVYLPSNKRTIQQKTVWKYKMHVCNTICIGNCVIHIFFGYKILENHTRILNLVVGMVDFVLQLSSETIFLLQDYLHSGSSTRGRLGSV